MVDMWIPRECGDDSLHSNKWVMKTTWVCSKQMTNSFRKFILFPLALGNIPYSVWLRQVNSTAGAGATLRKVQGGARPGKWTALLHENNEQTQPGQNIQNWAPAGPEAESRAVETPICHIKTRKLNKNLETFVCQNEGLTAYIGKLGLTRCMSYCAFKSQQMPNLFKGPINI